MRFLAFVMFSVILTQLTACGQTGALVLPNDQNQDKRSRYLLYPNNTATTPAAPAAKVDAQQAASHVATNTP
jgi:predicted small lipoprotein YifL